MSIVTAYNLAQSFGHNEIFSGISFKIEADSRIGLVGPNGVGKSSLLHILAGLEKPAAGGYFMTQQKRLGYLHQEAIDAFADQGRTLQAEMLTVFAPLQQMESELRQLEQQMAQGELSDALFADYSTLLETYEQQGGYTYETRIAQVLTGLGFGETDWVRPLAQFSGGQKTRALLARLLLESPDLLMLDEPTNHLDVESIAWLETILAQWQGALLIVSHDRYFLNRVVNTVWEMSASEIEVYRGNYSAYLKQRQERWATREQEFTAKQERLAKEMSFIYKHMGSGRGHNMAVGKLRRVSDELGTEGRAISVARAKEKFNALRRPDGEWNRMEMAINASQLSGKIILRTQRLQVGYRKPLFVADDIRLLRGECAALIGPNGSGKTTLVNTILGKLPPLAGGFQLGASLKIGYFAQAHDNLHPEQSVIDAFLHHQAVDQQPRLDADRARHSLARYLFQGDDVFKQIGALSGGERGRLALAILAQQGANFLVLDEPTNHLDIPAQESLQAALEQYEGTILLISHDRYLIDQLATQIWTIQEGRLQVYAGRYADFIRR
ncbi:MAG: ABC-F family ATP-binding cassette domain-containing protein [Caldilineaceae bacterium]